MTIVRRPSPFGEMTSHAEPTSDTPAEPKG
jgi:hypothetical protein